MTNLFDKNGNATETHIVTVSGFDPETGEHLSTYDVRIFAGTGIPGSSTLALAPTADVGNTVCWNGTAWGLVIDLRGTTVYEKATGSSVAVKVLGDLDDAYTSKAPYTQYDKWDGSEWVIDAAAQTAAEIADAEQKWSVLLVTANSEIDWRQDAADAGNATDKEIADLAAWRSYRVQLRRVNLSKPEWPTAPM